MPYEVRRPSETRRANVNPTRTAPARRRKAEALPAVLGTFFGSNKSKAQKLVVEKVAAAKVAAAKESEAAAGKSKDSSAKKK